MGTIYRTMRCSISSMTYIDLEICFRSQLNSRKVDVSHVILQIIRGPKRRIFLTALAGPLQRREGYNSNNLGLTHLHLRIIANKRQLQGPTTPLKCSADTHNFNSFKRRRLGSNKTTSDAKFDHYSSALLLPNLFSQNCVTRNTDAVTNDLLRNRFRGSTHTKSHVCNTPEIAKTSVFPEVAHGVHSFQALSPIVTRQAGKRGFQVWQTKTARYQVQFHDHTVYRDDNCSDTAGKDEQQLPIETHYARLTITPAKKYQSAITDSPRRFSKENQECH